MSESKLKRGRGKRIAKPEYLFHREGTRLQQQLRKLTQENSDDFQFKLAVFFNLN